MMRRRITVTVAMLAALALALPAIATPSADSANTLIEHGYDPEKAELYFSILDREEAEEAGDYECVVPGEDGEEEPTGDTATDDEIAEAVPVEEADGDADDDGAKDSEDDDFSCELTTVEVTGPNGQVNHGMVVSSLVHTLKEMGYTGIGCIVRIFAQSDYGKGDQQVKAGEDGDDDKDDEGKAEEISLDVEPADEVDDDGSTVELKQALTDCRKEREKDEDRDDEDEKDDDDRDEKSSDEKADRGKPDWAGKGKPEWAGKNGKNGGDDDKDDDRDEKSYEKESEGGKPAWAGNGKPGNGDSDDEKSGQGAGKGKSGK